MNLTLEHKLAFIEGYDDRWYKRTEGPKPGGRKGKLFRMYCVGYQQACTDIILKKTYGVQRAMGLVA